MLPSDLIFTMALEVDGPMPSIYRSYNTHSGFPAAELDGNTALCEASVHILDTAPSLIVVEGKDDIIDRSLCKTKVLYTGVLL